MHRMIVLLVLVPDCRHHRRNFVGEPRSGVVQTGLRCRAARVSLQLLRGQRSLCTTNREIFNNAELPLKLGVLQNSQCMHQHKAYFWNLGMSNQTECPKGRHKEKHLFATHLDHRLLSLITSVLFSLLSRSLDPGKYKVIVELASPDRRSYNATMSSGSH